MAAPTPPPSHQDLLDRPLFAHLATVRPDGSPQSGLMWFAWDGERARFSHTRNRQKIRNLAHEPRVSFHLVDPENSYRTLEVRGRVESVEADPEAAFYRSLQERYDFVVPVFDADLRVVITVAPTRFVAVDGGLTHEEMVALTESLSTDDRPIVDPAEVTTSALSAPGDLTALIRHFSDLRDGTHGGSVSRHEKENHFSHEVELLAPVARQVLDEMNTHLLLGTGSIIETGLQRGPDGGLSASWELTWPEQEAAGVPPVTLYAYYGISFHHPHLRGATVGDWPLNVFTVQDAADQLPIMRAIAASDAHNLVFQADYRIIPAVVRPSADEGRG